MEEVSKSQLTEERVIMLENQINFFLGRLESPKCSKNAQIIAQKVNKMSESDLGKVIQKLQVRYSADVKKNPILIRLLNKYISTISKYNKSPKRSWHRWHLWIVSKIVISFRGVFTLEKEFES